METGPGYGGARLGQKDDAMTDPVPEASVEFAFEAAFKTPFDPRPVAGAFRAEVVTTAAREPACGGARDPAEVRMLVGDLRKALDGRYLNAVTGLSVPTLENLARW